MLKTKRFLSVLTALLMLIPLFCIAPSAEENANWIFINGENITRRADTVIIYKGIASTGQSQWGHDVIVDAENTVIDIIEGGLSEGENLKIPENCYVISAAGTKVQWFKSNVKVGSKLFYDSYTSRLFVCGKDDKIIPYFTMEKEVSGEDNYILLNPEVSGTPAYTYDIAVNAEGVVTARGSDVKAEEGGFIISAATEADRQFLIMYAPLGASCTVVEGVATFTYDEDMLSRTAELETAISEKLFEAASGAFYSFDIEAAGNALNEAKETDTDRLDYRTLISLLNKLENEVNRVCIDKDANELRAAFHTPKETDITAVRETVKTAKANGLNTLFLRVSNGYGTFIPLPEDNKFRQDSSFGGFDVLKAYITVCEEENIALGLSVDVYYNEYASIAASDWTTVTNGTEKGLSEKYYSPASVGFKNYFTDYIKHIVSEYEIDTVLLDYLRYPKFREDCDLGYDYDTVAAFAKEYSVPLDEAEAIKTELFDSPHWQKWVEFRMGLVTDMAKTISEAINSVRTDVTLIAISARDTVDHFYMQDTVQWLEDGLIDGICLSLYERDEAENDVIDPLAYGDGLVSGKGEIIGAYTGKTAYFFTALETAKTIDGDTMTGMITDSRNLGADGYIFSSLSDYIAQNYYVLLSENVMSENAFSPVGNAQNVMKQTLEYSKNKIDAILKNGGCDESTATSALSKINEALVLLEDNILTHEQAVKLEGDIAIIFSSSPSKQTVLKEFQAITKSALLYKEIVETTPPVTEPDESSMPAESETPLESSEDSAEQSSSVSDAEDKKELNINVGNILIYAFVGIATVAAVAAMIIAFKRKSKLPANHHMPKASLKQEENNNEE